MLVIKSQETGRLTGQWAAISEGGGVGSPYCEISGIPGEEVGRLHAIFQIVPAIRAGQCQTFERTRDGGDISAPASHLATAYRRWDRITREIKGTLNISPIGVIDRSVQRKLPIQKFLLGSDFVSP